MMNDLEALTVLSALAQDTRLRVMRALLRSHPAGRVAAAVEGTPSTISFHLAQLEQAGLVRSRRQANSVIYTAVPEALGGLVTYLMADCCGGRPGMCTDGGEPAPAADSPAPEAAKAPCCGPARIKR